MDKYNNENCYSTNIQTTVAVVLIVISLCNATITHQNAMPVIWLFILSLSNQTKYTIKEKKYVMLEIEIFLLNLHCDKY